MNITAIAIVAIVCWAIVELVTGFRNKKTHKQDNLRLEQMQQSVHQLQERVQVLEKIVTDQNYDLKKEFDNLKD
ncbi:hypothetical protein HMF8227_02238 [Saliniradius amylolyticus]|uniref:Phage shock protein B n=1 Tax=Saliniradius amylolyticus TaxID=2183582 RepID=A0A2S2E4V9_9ALTE|nr:hypothetical protein [Saliniradius amylolyticus]AWL12691.1 hypothetical protein HMF8227_02238 [Saliniradius amylolyticus]